MNYYLAAGIFGAYFITHVFYVKIVLYICDRDSFKAANYSTLSTVIMTLGIIQCAESRWYLIPLAAGAWFGTFYATKSKVKDSPDG